MKEGSQHAVLKARFHSWSLLQSLPQETEKKKIILAESWLTANLNIPLIYRSTQFINIQVQ